MSHDEADDHHGVVITDAVGGLSLRLKELYFRRRWKACVDAASCLALTHASDGAARDDALLIGALALIHLDPLAALVQLRLMYRHTPAHHLALKEAALQSVPNCAVVRNGRIDRALVARGDLARGTTLLSYASPIPPRGLGQLSNTGLSDTYHVDDDITAEYTRRLALHGTRCVAVSSLDAIRVVREARRQESTDSIAIAMRCRWLVLRRLHGHLGGNSSPTTTFFLRDFAAVARHSCNPNMLVDEVQHRLIALRSIAYGCALTLAHCPRYVLALPSHLRESHLFLSHTMPECTCSRCRSARVHGDLLRRIRCLRTACPGAMLRRALPPACSFSSWGGQWTCDTCQTKASDDVMPLAAEESCGDTVRELWSKRSLPLERSERSNYLEQCRAALLRVADALGSLHWTYLFLLECFAEYFFAIASKVSTRTADVAYLCASTFALKYVYLAKRHHLHETAPLLVGYWCVRAAKKLFAAAPHLRRDVAVLVMEAQSVMGDALEGCCLLDDDIVEACAALSSDETDTRSHRLDVLRRVGEDEQDTISVWTDHLTQRLLSERRQGAESSPLNPAALLQSLQRRQQ